MRIKKLNKSTLDQAIKLRNQVFPILEPFEEETIVASVYPQKYKLWYKKAEIQRLNYWLMLNEEMKVVGVVGLYTQSGDKKNRVWLGWFCVDPNYRGHKIGSKLLDFAIEESINEGYKELHLYTTRDSEYAKARELYERRGFVCYRETKKNNMLFYKLQMSQNEL